MKKCVASLFGLLLWSCQNEKATAPDFRYVDLLPASSISIVCDSVIPFYELIHQIPVPGNPDTAQRILIGTKGAIFKLDPGSRQVQKVFGIPSEGPGGISGKSDQDGLVCFNDTLWGYTHSWKHKFYLLTPMDAEEVFSFPDDGVNTFMHHHYSHPIGHGNTILIPVYFNSARAKGKEKFAFLQGHLETKKFELVVPFSSKYDEAFWGGTPWPYLASAIFLERSKEYVVSFPIDHTLYVYDERMKLKRKVLLPSQDLPEKFTPFQKKYNENTFDYIKDRTYYSLLSFYFGLVHDPVNHRIYRVVRVVNPDPNNPKNNPIQTINLVICDEKLNYLGEWKIPPQYDPVSSLLINSQGLWMLDDEKTDSTETLLTFDIFDGKFKKE